MNGGWVGGLGSERNREGDNCTLLCEILVSTFYRFSMHNLYCTTPGVFLDRERQYWGVSFWTKSVNTGGVKTNRLIVLGSLYVQRDALWVFIDSFFRLVTTSTNSPLQFGWFRLKTEVSSVLFESKLEKV